jgi:hypothetical protein
MRAVLIACVLLSASPALAWESWLEDAQRPVRPRYGVSGYPDTTYPRSYWQNGQRYVRVYRPRQRYYYAAPKHTHNHTSSSDYGSSATCYAAIRVVGSQGVSEDAAETSAQKGWMEAVRWKHGEHAMDIGGARSYVKRCSRSSIGEFLDKTFHRCEVEAKPCRPKFEDGK